MWRPRRNGLAGLLILCAAVCGTPVYADRGFSGGVTPSRFEISSQPGDVLRRALKIYNLSSRPQRYQVKTVDWQYSEGGQISFQDALAPDSCRQWVALERHTISVVPDPQQPRNFRFEVAVPAAAPAQECRLALMIEGLDSSFDANFADGAITMPIAGRIAVIIYLRVGDVTPELEIGDLVVHEHAGQLLPSVEVRNLGAAHGRLDADLVAETAAGKAVRLAIATSPILPGQTRQLALTPEAGQTLSYPLTIKGRIYSDGKSIAVEQDLKSADRSLFARQRSAAPAVAAAADR